MPVTPTPKPRSERSTPYSLTYRPTPSSSDPDAAFDALQSTPSLSSSSSDSGGSEYAPAPPSPSPTPKAKISGKALARSSGKSRVDEQEDEVKPDIKKRVIGKNVSRGGSSIGSGGNSGSPGKGSAYAPQEDWELFQLLRPKTPQVNWAEVARKVGRDAKSCQNRWALLNKKLEGAIKGIGA
ncbi:hypothetical protein JCM24511_06839 [Saitozyma sp. JCM 24511]|nr:hypothetical protein JCM24511_06839 [Saitozyma sp. JCM 24511]